MSEPAKELWTDTNRLLRYILSGFVVLAVAWAADRPHTVLADMRTTAGSPWPVLLLAPVLGVVLYSVHLVLCWPVYGFLSYWSGSSHGLADRKTAWQEHIELAGKRWEARFGEDSSVRARELMFQAWASQIHFLYCSAWALIVTPIFLLCVGRDVVLWAPIASGLGFFALTFFDDVRQARVISASYFPGVRRTRPVVSVGTSQRLQHTVEPAHSGVMRRLEIVAKWVTLVAALGAAGLFLWKWLAGASAPTFVSVGANFMSVALVSSLISLGGVNLFSLKRRLGASEKQLAAFDTRCPFTALLGDDDDDVRRPGNPEFCIKCPLAIDTIGDEQRGFLMHRCSVYEDLHRRWRELPQAQTWIRHRKGD